MYFNYYLRRVKFYFKRMLKILNFSIKLNAVVAAYSDQVCSKVFVLSL